ncbi:NAD(P)H-binding protein [Luteimonas sp. RD2P54]|uniref:NAD(P)H-binding protein n=1 Tax=Luteimonas endophytica TaxID=3042023 RepID=A0ABT6JDZ6_9GAMM|nr:NAD(P)H-binding protein [Luteimonas endophytica]MDH5825041.1 NAD(P)H-binding protein [Luteimonas endophytica]
MHIILGGTGHVGSAVCAALLARGEPVTVLTRDAAHAEPQRARGAKIEDVDVLDAAALREVLRSGRRAYLLNPPASPSEDTDAELRSVRAIVAALEDSGLEKLVAQSSYGVQPGRRIGDLGVLHEFERSLRDQPIPVDVLRAAYFMSNWDAAVESARTEGRLDTMLPVDFRLPMVAPADIGEVAARLMTADGVAADPHYVEGPERYTPSDVARALSHALGREVEARATPRAQWRESFRTLGFSPAAAESYAGMTALTVDRPEWPSDPVRGSTSLRAYIGERVATIGG